MIHCGTNNLILQIPEFWKIANDIIQLEKVVKRKKNDVVISGINQPRDRFNQKVNDFNQLLAGKCGENDFDYMPHNNINPNKAGIFEGSFPCRGGGEQFVLPSFIFQEELV